VSVPCFVEETHKNTQKQKRTEKNSRYEKGNSGFTAKMVHLAKVHNDSEVKKTPLQEQMVELCLAAPENDTISTSVYGSRFAADDLPSHEMPEKEMPKEFAYRMIKDELSLDGNPLLKYQRPQS
jgi:hypothetical protein